MAIVVAALSATAVAVALNGSEPSGEFSVANPEPRTSRLPDKFNNPAIKY